ncbi:hypothetical protein HYALB_00012561 [Hymenoscyphus albidus]|uniref:Uncharacterized protein n=1 Tax=Hymenoscyphus albidus TaxID=595503 RepID=A0A9N9LVY3_9HELO|nr:hypothetical protein HYALB_00012561 [Hymenoscyphus albidus]
MDLVFPRTGDHTSPRKIPNQPSSKKPKQPESSKVDDKPGQAHSNNPSTDPSIAGILQQTVKKSGDLTGPAMEKILRGATWQQAAGKDHI